MATAELALALPALVAVSAMLIAAVGITAMQVRVCEAARVAARAAALGQSTSVPVTSRNSGIAVVVTQEGSWVKTNATMRPPGIFADLVTVNCKVTGINEKY